MVFSIDNLLFYILFFFFDKLKPKLRAEMTIVYENIYLLLSMEQYKELEKLEFE